MSLGKILVVDDEVLVARDLKQHLEDLGFEVPNFASSSEEAIKMAIETKPDLILMDIRLGGTLDGIETTQKITKQLDVPVIYLTAYSDQATLDRAKSTSPFGYIFKPFQERELKISIELALIKHKATQMMIRAQRLENLGFLAAEIADQIRTLLNSVMINISLTKKKVQGESSILEHLTNAEKTCHAITLFTERLLILSKTEMPIKKIINIGNYLKQLAELFVHEQPNIQVEFLIPKDLWSVEMDEGQFRQLIGILMHNAFESMMPKGGHLTIRAFNMDNETKVQSPQPVGPHVHIEIEDQGIGIEKADISRIFEPFFSTKKYYCGLGLTIAKSIVEKHGWQIFVQSHPGKGSCFTLIFPL